MLTGLLGRAVRGKACWAPGCRSQLLPLPSEPRPRTSAGRGVKRGGRGVVRDPAHTPQAPTPHLGGIFPEGGAGMWAQSLQSCLTLSDPMDGSPPGSSVHGDSPGKNTRVGCHALLQGSSRPRDRTCASQSPALAGDSLPTNVTGQAPFLPCTKMLMGSYSLGRM